MSAPGFEALGTGPAGDIYELLVPEDLRADLEADARAGLTATPKWLPPKYFYDDHGSRLFEEITRLPEYYPTRAEHALLQAHAGEIAEAAGNPVLIELGSGSSEKTRLLLDAMTERELHSYIPIDVSAGALREAMVRLRRDYPGTDIVGAVADFDRHMHLLPVPAPRTIALLGGTIGNYPPAQRTTFLTGLTDAMLPGETFLLGIDLVKSPARLVAAYDDAAGVTAEFNRNVLRVLNRELGGDFDPTDFEHVAVWDETNEWIEMRLRARRAVSARLAAIDLIVDFVAGEEMRTEISAKFRRERIVPELAQVGLHTEGWWSDGDFALVLARRSDA